MNIILKKGSIENASKAYTRVRITEEPKGTKRLVREKGFETLELGTGKYADITARKFLLLCRSIVQASKAGRHKKIAIQFDDVVKLFKNLKDRTSEDLARLAAENFEMADFDFNIFKTEPKEGWHAVEEILLYEHSSTALEKAVRKGQEIGRAVNACRTLANTPGGDMTPTLLAAAGLAAARSVGGGPKIKEKAL